MSTQVRVAVVQASPIPFDKDAAVAKVARLTREAAAKGAKIVLFPEAYIPCYPRGMHFGSNVGKRTDEGRKDFRRYYEQAIPVPGEETLLLGQAAAEAGVYLNVGVIERDNGSLHCTVVFFGPDGTYLGKHRKLKPTGSERLIWSQGDGSTLTVVDTPYGTMGSVICWENYMPLLRAAMYAKGTAIYLAPTADARDSWQATIKHIALEGRCFVLSCNQYQTKDMVPTDLPGYGDLDAEPDLMCRGGSAILDPLGNYLAGPLYGEEGILVADLDLGRLAEARYDFDVVDHYARNDVFTLLVDERPQRGIEFITEDNA
ncbi:Bifunctional nitrilase/nitrile hydratase NIT4B [uncultured delta proteobacterium]|uniref:Bifunctional nitrilase/nitrile hydratase NIT4B n=1 Tax=uncultured delta proteobacterium TaxID=34034 RepID=A0A212IW40_9DELT|nr:Bifunctional nitrilase/nitrile hydratase NIT4B [uncultured delta proteobacterium]